MKPIMNRNLRSPNAKILVFKFKRSLALLTFALLFVCTDTVFGQNWYNSSWSYRKTITVKSGQVPSTQTNFPFLVNLASDAGLSAHARSDGFDILFTISDGTTKIAYEREKFTSTTGALVAWVNVPSVSNGTVIYMYYGNPGETTDQQAASGAVWNPNYAGVYHIDEPGAGTAGEYKDATSVANNGTVYDTNIFQAAFTHTASGGNDFRYQELTAPGDYVITAGDVLVYDVYWTSATDMTAVDLITPTDALRNYFATALDQNGLAAHPGANLSTYALSQWYHRIIHIPAAMNGKTITKYDIACEYDGSGTKTAYFSNIYIINNGNIRVNIYSQGGAITNAQDISNPATYTVGFTIVPNPSVPNRSVTGKIATALNGNATRYVGMGAAATTQVDNWTIEAWVNPFLLNQHGYFVYNGNDSGGYGIGLGDGAGNAGSKLLGLYGTVSWFPTGYIFPAANTWYHVVMERSGGTSKFYVNGNSITGGGTATPNAVNARLTIGNELDASNTPYRYFNGAVDEVRISSTARSADWIKTEYNNQSSSSTFYMLSSESVEVGPCIVENPTAGEGVPICKGGSTQLSASGGTYYEWSPVTGLSNPNIFNPIANPLTTTTYTVQVSSSSGELVPNSNFEGGNTGFTSFYNYVNTPYAGSPTSGLWSEGTFAVTSNPNPYHPSFYGTGHGGSGNFMAVNGATTAGIEVWGVDLVKVEPNTNYYFSTWICSIYNQNVSLANLAFSINHVLIGPVITAPAMVGNTNPWTQFYAVWNSGSSTTAYIQIINQNTIAGGNDFGLDDISFSTVCSATDQVTVSVADPAITTQPAPVTECVGGTTALSITASGGTPILNYQWYSNTEDNTTMGSPITGATSDSYTPPASAAGIIYYYVTAAATDIECSTATSNTASVTVVADPSISTQPTGFSECVGGIDPLSVTASGGTPTLNYQWYSNTVNSLGGIPVGTNSNTYTPVSTAAGTLYYYVVASATGGGCGTSTSDIVPVTIVTDPSISTQPTGFSECVGGTDPLSVTASGGTPTLNYQWYSNTVNSLGGTPVGTNSNTYTPVSTTAGTLYYYVVASATGGGCGTATSDIVPVTITADPSISTQPTGFSECVGGTDQLSVTASGGTPTLNYQWYSNTVNSLGGIPVGTNSNTYTPVSTAAGTLYYYVVASATGGGCGTATSDIVPVTITADPSISTPPTGFSECVGGTDQLSVTASGGTPTLNYQWYSNTVNSLGGIPVGTNSNTYTPVSTAAGTLYYYVVASATGGGCGTATSDIVPVTIVTDPSISTQPTGFSECLGGSQQLSVSASGGTPTLNYQWYSNTVNSLGGTPVGTNSNTYTPVSTTAGTLYYYVVASATGGGCGTATSDIVPATITADPSISTQPTGFSECLGGSQQLSVSASGGTLTLNYQWYSNTEDNTTTGILITGATSDTYTPPSSTAGTLYYFVTASATGSGCGTATSNVASVTITADPSISTQPTGFSECVGGTDPLSVTASGGTPTLNYQWYSNTVNSLGGTPVGTNSNTYIPVSTTAGTLYYYVVASATGGGCGTSTSDIVPVTIVTDPSISTQPTGFSECLGGSQQLSVSASGGTPSLTYQWYTNLNDNNTDGTLIPGATSSNYTPPASAPGIIYYYVTASATGNGCGTATSDQAAVTIVTDPSISTQPTGFSECLGGSQQLSVSASGGTPTLNYQWYSNTVNSLGGTPCRDQQQYLYPCFHNRRDIVLLCCCLSHGWWLRHSDLGYCSGDHHR